MRSILIAMIIALSGCTIVSTPVQFRQYEGKEQDTQTLINRYCIDEKCKEVMNKLPFYKVTRVFESHLIYASQTHSPKKQCMVLRTELLNQWYDMCQDIYAANDGFNYYDYFNDSYKRSQKINHVGLDYWQTREKTTHEVAIFSNGKMSKEDYYKELQFHFDGWKKRQCDINYVLTYVSNVSDCIDNTNQEMNEIAEEMAKDGIVKSGFIRNSFSFNDNLPHEHVDFFQQTYKVNNDVIRSIAKVKNKCTKDKNGISCKSENAIHSYKGDNISTIIPRHNANHLKEMAFDNNHRYGHEDRIANRSHVEEHQARDTGIFADMVGKTVVKTIVKQHTGWWWL